MIFHEQMRNARGTTRTSFYTSSFQFVFSNLITAELRPAFDVKADSLLSRRIIAFLFQA